MPRKKKGPATNAEPELTPSDLGSLIDELKNDSLWQKQQEKHRKFHALYHDEHPVESIKATENMMVDPAKNIVRLGRARELVDHMTGLKLVYPKYSITPHGLGPTPEKTAEKIEKWANAILPLIEYEQGQDTNDLVTQEIDLFALTGVEVFPLPNAWQESQPRRKDYDSAEDYNGARKTYVENTAPIPIAVWHVPAMGWYPLLDGRIIRRSVSIDKVTAGWVRGRYGDVEAIKDMNETQQVEFINYLDSKIRGFYIMNNDSLSDPLEIWEHKMPLNNRAPMVLYEGLTTSDRRPGYRWSSILEPIYSALTTLDFLASRKRLMTAAYYLPTMLRFIAANAAINPTNQQDKRTLELGQVNTFVEGEKLEPWTPPPELPDAEGMARELNERVERTLPAVLQGVFGSQTPGYTFNQAVEFALRRHQPVTERTAMSDVEVMKLIFMALKAWEEISGQKKVYIRRRSDKGSESIGLGWEEVRDFTQLLSAARERTMQIDNLANLQAAKEAVEGPLQLPRNWAAREFVNIENYEELYEQRMAEDLVRRPPIVNRTEAEIMSKLQIVIDRQEAIAPTEMDQNTLPPGMQQLIQPRPRTGQTQQPGGPNLVTSDVGISGASP